jgi:hypothetical protein
MASVREHNCYSMDNELSEFSFLRGRTQSEIRFSSCGVEIDQNIYVTFRNAVYILLQTAYAFTCHLRSVPMIGIPGITEV